MVIAMSATTTTSPATSEGTPITSLAPTCMVSVNRIAKLPVVESTIHTATTVYEKVKDYNSVTHWTFAKAENVVNIAVEVGKPIVVPVVQSLERPIKTVDGLLCTGLDYVEDKVPAVKLPPKEIYCTTKDYVNKNITPKVETVYSYVQPTVNSAYEKVEPAVQSAKTVVEPVVEKAKHMVEPYVQPAIEKAQALKNYVIDEMQCDANDSTRTDNSEDDEDGPDADKVESDKHY